MNMADYIKVLKSHVHTHAPNFGDGESVLSMLYEAYAECNKMDDDTIKADFNELYRLMNGMELHKMDNIIYPVCSLCRDHERSGFIHGVQIGIHLARETGSSQ